VLVWSGEDDPADTLLPRLLAAGADLTRVHFVGEVVEQGQRRPFDPASDIHRAAGCRPRVARLRFILIDPVVSAVAGDSHKNTEVRRGLQPLVDFATASAGAALVGITHFSKGGQGQDPSATRHRQHCLHRRCSRGAGGREGQRRRKATSAAYWLEAKSNIGPDEGGFSYTLEQCEALPGIWTSRVVWGDALAGSARELLAEPEESREAAGPSNEASDFLRERLALGMCPSKTIKAEAEEAGIAWRTVRRAADKLGVVTRKGGMNAGWYWSLPSTEGAHKSSEEVERAQEGT
jgi:putative DNA primase/helicase